MNASNALPSPQQSISDIDSPESYRTWLREICEAGELPQLSQLLSAARQASSGAAAAFHQRIEPRLSDDLEIYRRRVHRAGIRRDLYEAGTFSALLSEAGRTLHARGKAASGPLSRDQTGPFKSTLDALARQDGQQARFFHIALAYVRGKKPTDLEAEMNMEEIDRSPRYLWRYARRRELASELKIVQPSEEYDRFLAWLRT